MGNGRGVIVKHKRWRMSKNTSVFHPGYYIAEIIEDMGIGQSEFADRVGISFETLNNIVDGRSDISNDIAKKLSIMLGMSSEIWLNLQNNCNQKVIEIQKVQTTDLY